MMPGSDVECRHDFFWLHWREERLVALQCIFKTAEFIVAHFTAPPCESNMNTSKNVIIFENNGISVYYCYVSRDQKMP